MRRDDARSPIGGKRFAGEGADHLLGVPAVEEVEPHGDGGQHAGLVHRLAVGTDGEGIAIGRQPEPVFKRFAFLDELRFEFLRALAVVQ
jgi:hypothetical protein